MFRITLIALAMAGIASAQRPIVGTFDHDGALIVSVETSASLPDWTRTRSPVPAIEPPPVAVPGRVLYSPIIQQQPVRQAVERVISIPQQVFSAPVQRYNPPHIDADNCVGGT